jgi:hypothetical protein
METCYHFEQDYQKPLGNVSRHNFLPDCQCLGHIRVSGCSAGCNFLFPSNIGLEGCYLQVIVDISMISGGSERKKERKEGRKEGRKKEKEEKGIPLLEYILLSSL